jgi:hypothetical protein
MGRNQRRSKSRRSDCHPASARFPSGERHAAKKAKREQPSEALPLLPPGFAVPKTGPGGVPGLMGPMFGPGAAQGVGKKSRPAAPAYEGDPLDGIVPLTIVIDGVPLGAKKKAG